MQILYLVDQPSILIGLFDEKTILPFLWLLFFCRLLDFYWVVTVYELWLIFFLFSLYIIFYLKLWPTYCRQMQSFLKSNFMVSKWNPFFSLYFFFSHCMNFDLLWQKYFLQAPKFIRSNLSINQSRQSFGHKNNAIISSHQCVYQVNNFIFAKSIK